MSALSASAILVEHGVDPVPILTCRDRNRAALRRELLGMKALGVGSVILMRGPRVPKKHAVQASTVFDLTGRELVGLAAVLNGGQQGEEGGGLYIGTAAKAHRPRRGWRAESLKARVEAGARFLQTQLCFNPELLRQYMKRLSETGLSPKCPVVVSLSPLPSAATASWIRKTMGDARIPGDVITRLEDAANPEQEGIRICGELIREISEIPGISGINLMTTGNPEAIPAAIEASGLRNRC